MGGLGWGIGGDPALEGARSPMETQMTTGFSLGVLPGGSRAASPPPVRLGERKAFVLLFT